MFRNLKLIGDPVIPREVRMSEDDSLRGWSATDSEQVGRQDYGRARSAAPDGSTIEHDWFAKGGVKGDFDVTASFIKFEPGPPKETERTECSLILSALLSDEAQTITKLSCRHLRIAGRDDYQRGFIRANNGRPALDYPIQHDHM